MIKKMSNIKNGSKKKMMAEIKKWRYLRKEKELNDVIYLDLKNVVKLRIGQKIIFMINFLICLHFFTKSKNIFFFINL